MRSLPFDFISATMPPSVSTCASSSRPPSLPPFTVTSTPPFCVRSAMKPNISKLSCTHCAARSVYPDGLSMPISSMALSAA